MNQEQADFAAKLLLIQSEAQLVLRELPPGVVRDRLQHIATVAEILRTRIGSIAAEPRVSPSKSKGSS